MEIPGVMRHKKDHKEARAGFWAPPPNTACDSSIHLVNATFDYIQREIVERQGGVDFVVWTGDNVRHDNDNRYPRTLKQIYASNEFMGIKMQEIFGSDKYSPEFIPVIPTVGNNDVYPHNIMFAGPNSKTISTYKSMWKTWIPPEQSHTFDRGAYFHIPVAPKLVVVSLNSLYFYENNKAVDGCSSRDEPGTLQLDWLAIQLRLFRLQGIKVWIIGHVPPTDRQWYTACYDRYANLMVQYRDLVIGQLFGHVNIDHFYFMKYKEQTSLSIDAHHASAPKLGPMLGREESQISKNPHFHISKNPLDVLAEARETFDALPRSPRKSKGTIRAAFDIDSAFGNLAVVNVAPSIVPNYFPTLRIYHYLTSASEILPTYLESGIEGESIAKKKKKKKKKKPKHQIPPVELLGPGYIRQQYTPLKYIQYYLNTTTANANHSSHQVEYQIEYDTSEWPYFMSDLTIGNWVSLGKEISGLDGHGKLPKAPSDENISEDVRDYFSRSLQRLTAYAYDVTGSKRRRKKKKEKQKNKRRNGMWSIFTFRGFVSTGLEAEYEEEQ